MRRFGGMLVFSVLLIAAALAAIVAFSRPSAPPPQASIAAPFRAVDFSDLPQPTIFPARDATPLAYRRYAGNPDRVVVLIHGSSASSASMHAVAYALAAAGATVIVPDIRGHGGSGPHGDIAYIGQLEDDLEDLLNVFGQPHQAAETTLIGFSSGGGFALRIAGGRLAPRFSRTILLAPFLRYDAPNARPSAGGWTSVAVPRLLTLSLLNSVGITSFNGLPVLAFAIEAGNPNHLTATYSYRLLTNFAPDDDFLGDVRRAPRPLMVVAGADDEIFRSDQLHAALAPAKPDIRVDIVPGIGHIGLITTAAGTAAIVAAWQSKF
jgi:non-heme chloroperoxidase